MRDWDLNIKYAYENIKDKINKVKELSSQFGFSLEEVAYIGDDVSDIKCIEQCGISGCPSDAHEEVVKACDYVCKKSGGNGAVREFIDWICDFKEV